MNVHEAIFLRRSIRSFTPQNVEERLVRDLVDAAVQAPSAMNEHPWRFSIVQDRAQLERWSGRAKKMLLGEASAHATGTHMADLLSTDAFNIFYDAGTLVVIGADAPGTYVEADCWLAAENLMLAACDAGLATCCIGFAIPYLNTVEAKAELGLAPAGVVVAPVVVGYPSTRPDPAHREKAKIVKWTGAGTARAT